MQFGRLLLFLLCLGILVPPATPATVLVLHFHNTSQYSDLNWVGESIAETLMSEFGHQDEIVLDRAARLETLRTLSLKPDGGFTKATLLKLGQTLDADVICYGNFEVSLPSPDSPLKESSVRITARYLDLKKLHEGPELSEAGKLSDLSRLEEHLAWQSLKYLQPQANLDPAAFLSDQKLVRVDAKESYIRGLMSANRDQQQKWFLQSAQLDPRFVSPSFELGNLALNKKEYKVAIEWFDHVPPADPRYQAARFKMGLAAYDAGDFATAVSNFRGVLKAAPLNEVYNNLGAAENRLNQPIAIDDFRHAVDGDQNDPTYLFNLGASLLKNNYFDEAIQRLQSALNHNPDDHEAEILLAKAQSRERTVPGAKVLAPERLKENFDITAFRQLKAMLQPKSK